MKNLILLAVQGAGKGTLAKELSAKHGYIHISMGDILRERALVDDEMGTKIKEMIDHGILVPNDIIFEAVRYKIAQPECQNGYILDGFPRNLEQAMGYDEIISQMGKDLGIVINMVVSNELLAQRIVGRRICRDCGAIYNIYSEEKKSKLDGICDECKGELYQRADDNEEAMKTRIDTYFKVTEPVIQYYKDKGILYEIDATNAEQSLQQVEKILKSFGDLVD